VGNGTTTGAIFVAVILDDQQIGDKFGGDTRPHYFGGYAQSRPHQFGYTRPHYFGEDADGYPLGLWDR
jgi:hypothetical protein